MSPQPESLLDLNEPLPVDPIPPAPAAASLEGLEVQESSLAAWLAAGGERRTRPRELPEDPA